MVCVYFPCVTVSYGYCWCTRNELLDEMVLILSCYMSTLRSFYWVCITMYSREPNLCVWKIKFLSSSGCVRRHCRLFNSRRVLKFEFDFVTILKCFFKNEVLYEIFWVNCLIILLQFKRCHHFTLDVSSNINLTNEKLLNFPTGSLLCTYGFYWFRNYVLNVCSPRFKEKTSNLTSI